MNLENIISTLMDNVSKEERETIFNIYGKTVNVYTSDASFVRHYRKRLQAGIDNNLVEIVCHDKYGITFSFNYKYLKLGFPLKNTENSEEN